MEKNIADFGGVNNGEQFLSWHTLLCKMFQLIYG